jgi:FlaA1/EpsC-like NDP-sugar epimerase
MTIPEACQLVLEAGFMGKGGEIFVFEMGNPVKITDLARQMIRLSGLVPEKDTKIVYSGLRPCFARSLIWILSVSTFTLSC